MLYDLDETARCLSINMEHLHWKSDRSEIKEAIRAAIIDDVIGIKIPALHGLAEILRELADEMPVINATKLNWRSTRSHTGLQWPCGQSQTQQESEAPRAMPLDTSNG